MRIAKACYRLSLTLTMHPKYYITLAHTVEMVCLIISK